MHITSLIDFSPALENKDCGFSQWRISPKGHVLCMFHKSNGINKLRLIFVPFVAVLMREDGGDMLRDPQGGGGSVDVCARQGGVAHEQRGGASAASRGDLAADQRWDRQCAGESVRGADADRGGDLSAAGP